MLDCWQSNDGVKRTRVLERRKSATVRVGDHFIGGEHPILVQSMTNTSTEDPASTAEQIRELHEAGSEIVRITVNTREAAAAVPAIVSLLEKHGVTCPLVGDFHYNGHTLLSEYKDCARLLSKYRINPGNVGRAERHDDNFRKMIDVAIENEKPVRIGVNWGSLDQELLSRLMDENNRLPDPLEAHQVLIDAIVASALESARMAELYGMDHDRIILSAKVSDLPDLLAVYRKLAAACDYPLHLGLTEAGMGSKGIVASSSALAILLNEGIGDTIRVSLTPEPGESRTAEVVVCQQILQCLKIRSFAPQVTSCPGCGRTSSALFQDLARQVQQHINKRRAGWQEKYSGFEDLKVAVMGCIVNGPGESKHADIGISLPGTGESPKAPVYVDGSYFTTLEGTRLAGEFIRILDDYVDRRFGK